MTAHESSLYDVERLESDLGLPLLNSGVEARSKPTYELYEDKMEIYDPVWGKETIDAQVLVDLAHTDALRRLQTVEQLTLPDRYKTIPNSAYFSRWEHVWGTVILTKRLAKEQGLDEEETVKLQLKALLADLCHTAHSHAGDWIFQGKGRGESLHDERKLSYAEAIGVSEILRRKGYSPEEILANEHDGIVDAPQPGLDVDRIDYTLREVYRWVDQVPELRQYLNKDSFTVRDGKIVMKNKTSAQLFGVCYNLLVSEHWQEPAHRLQLELFMESIRRAFVARHKQPNEFGTYKPIDLMMTSDDVLQRVSDEPDDFMHILHELMEGMSISELGTRWRARADRIRTALATVIEGEAESIEWIKNRYDKLPRAYEIEPAKGSRLQSGARMLVLPLVKLRKRWVAPSYIDEDDNDEIKSLENDEAYIAYLDAAFKEILVDWRAAIIGNKAATAALKECLRINEERWPAVMARPSMPTDVIRGQLRRTVSSTNGAASKFIEFTFHG